MSGVKEGQNRQGEAENMGGEEERSKEGDEETRRK